MKRYSELNTVELVEANLAGEHAGVPIEPRTADRNLKNLESSLVREIADKQAAYDEVKSKVSKVGEEAVRDFMRHFEHMQELLVTLREVIA